MSDNPILFVQYVTPNEIYAAATILPVLAIITLCGRYYVRYSRQVELGADDYLLIPSLAFLIGWSITFIIGVHDRAFGYPTPEQSTEAGFLNTAAELAVTFLKLEFAMTIFLVLTFGFIKLSILFFYRRIFVTTMKGWTSTTLWVAIGIVAAWTLTFFLVSILDCKSDVSANWGSRENELTHCINTYESGTALHVSEFITSVMVAFLPIPMIWQLHLSTIRKLQIIGVMMLAFLAIAVSIVRLILLFDITTKSETYHIDHDLVTATLYYFGLLEGAIAFIASCLPTVHVLVNRASINTMIRSGRSLISLPFSSRRSRGSSTDRPTDADDIRVTGLTKPSATFADGRTASQGRTASTSTNDLKHDLDYPAQEGIPLEQQQPRDRTGMGNAQSHSRTDNEWQQAV